MSSLKRRPKSVFAHMRARLRMYARAWGETQASARRRVGEAWETGRFGAFDAGAAGDVRLGVRLA